MTQSYTASFYLGGGMFAIGAAFHLVLQLPCIRKKTHMEGEVDIKMSETEAEAAV